MKAAPLGVLIALVLLSLAVLPSASASLTLTDKWQIVTMKGQNETIQFDSDSIMNITVYPPKTLQTGGVRSLVIWSGAQNKELVRYSLGYYTSGNQTSLGVKNVSVNLGAFTQLIHGDTLQIQVRNPSEVIEYSTAVSISVDIEALLALQRQYFLGLLNLQENEIANLAYQLAVTSDTLTKYIEVLAIINAFVIAFVTREKWLFRKRKTEEEKSTSEFESFLETFVLERYSSGDKKVEVEDGVQA